jgi:hypothetical protein
MVYPLLAASGAAISGGLGFLGAKKQQEQQAKLFKLILNSYRKIYGDESIAYGKAQTLLGQNLKDIGTGYGKAAKQLHFGANQASQAIKDQSKQAGADLKQSMISSGLVGSSVMGNAHTGLAAQTGKALGKVSAGLGSQLADLELGKTQATSAAKGSLANLYLQPSPYQKFQLNKAQLYGGIQPQNPYAGVGQALGSIFGAYSGAQVGNAQIGALKALTSQAYSPLAQQYALQASLSPFGVNLFG